jgi:hypothetical protein
MSDHKVELTELEKSGLHKHGLPIGCPSQLSDSFRHGMKFALNNSEKKLEQAEARVADLVKALQDAADIIQADANTEENYGSLCRMGSVLTKDSSGAWLLRQKADAIDEAARMCMPGPCGPPDNPPEGYQEYCEGVASVRDYADNLRVEAGKAEGGV